MWDKLMVLRREIDKMREELGKELINNTDNRLNDKKLLELSVRLDEILVNYMRAVKENEARK